MPTECRTLVLDRSSSDRLPYLVTFVFAAHLERHFPCGLVGESKSRLAGNSFSEAVRKRNDRAQSVPECRVQQLVTVTISPLVVASKAMARTTSSIAL